MSEPEPITLAPGETATRVTNLTCGHVHTLIRNAYGYAQYEGDMSCTAFRNLIQAERDKTRARAAEQSRSKW